MVRYIVPCQTSGPLTNVSIVPTWYAHVTCNPSKPDDIITTGGKFDLSRTLRPGEADSLAAAQPAVVLIGNNIHSTEIASSLMGMVLAHRLTTSGDCREWDPEPEFAAGADFALDPDLAAHHGHEPLRDRQPETGA